MGKVLPSETAARACVAKLASQKEKQIQELLRDKKFFLIVDEAEVAKQKYISVFVGSLDAPNQNRTVFISLPNSTHKLIVRQNSYFTCSNRQSRRDQWSSSLVTARGQRQLLRPNDQSPQAKSLQLRPLQSNFRCHNITEKSEYDIKKPNHSARGPPAHKHRTRGQSKAITKS